MKKLIWIILAVLPCLLAFSLLALGEGTVTETTSLLGNVKKYSYAWTAGTNGNGFATDTTDWLNGRVLRVVFFPHANNPPTNLYDVTLTDSHGLDLLQGLGANLSSNTTTHVCPLVTGQDGSSITNGQPLVFDGTLSLVVTNTGSANQGTVSLYIGE